MSEQHDWKDDPRLMAFALEEWAELSEADVEEIEAALESDPVCRQVLEEMREVNERIARALASASAPAVEGLPGAARAEIALAARRGRPRPAGRGRSHFWRPGGGGVRLAAGRCLARSTPPPRCWRPWRHGHCQPAMPRVAVLDRRTWILDQVRDFMAEQQDPEAAGRGLVGDIATYVEQVPALPAASGPAPPPMYVEEGDVGRDCLLCALFLTCGRAHGPPRGAVRRRAPACAGSPLGPPTTRTPSTLTASLPPSTRPSIDGTRRTRASRRRRGASAASSCRTSRRSAAETRRPR